MLFGNDILNEQGAWAKSVDTLGEITLAKLEGNLARTRLTEAKKTEIYGLKLDIKIQELKAELGQVDTVKVPQVADMLEEETPPVVVI